MRNNDQIVLENLYLERVRNKDIREFLVNDPDTEEAEAVVDYISTLKEIQKETELYRGISPGEFNSLVRDGDIQSLGKGMTRKNVKGCYVSDSIQLAGRFAYRAWLDFGQGYILILNREKLEPLIPADEGNYITEKITLDSIEAIVDLDGKKIHHTPESLVGEE